IYHKSNPIFIQAEDGIRCRNVTGVQTCALPIFQRRMERASSLHSSLKVRNVPAISTLSGMTLLAPFPDIFPQDKTVGVRGSAILLTICCNEAITCALMAIGSMF